MPKSVIGQYNPQGVEAIYRRLSNMRATKRDYILQSGQVDFSASPEGLVSMRLAGASGQVFAIDNGAGEVFYPKWEDAEKAAGEGVSIRVVKDGEQYLSVNRTALSQYYDRLDVPARFANRLIDNKDGDLLCSLTQEIAKRHPQRWLVRATEGRVRAILSDSYRVVDNIDLFLCVAEALERPESAGKIWNGRLTDDNFWIFAVSDTLTGKVRTDRPSGLHQFKPIEGEDIHNAAATIRNSETGRGKLSVDPSLFREYCDNFACFGESLSQIHIGGKIEGDGLLEADDTRAAGSRHVWLRLRDAIHSVFDPKVFETWLARMNDATQTLVENPINAVGAVIDRFDLKQEDRDAIVSRLFSSTDLTRYGLIQAVTGQAHTYSESDPDYATTLEATGGILAKISRDEFASAICS